MSPKHPQDDGKPYTCQDTPDLFAPRIKRKMGRAAGSRKGWRNKKKMQAVNAGLPEPKNALAETLHRLRLEKK